MAIFVETYNDMENILIQTNTKSEMELLLALAEKMGLKTKHLSKSEVEDWQLARWIDDAMKSEDVTREEVMKTLGQ